MPEEYDDQHRGVSERIYSNSELHLEEFIRIALYLLSNNRDLGHHEDDFTPNSEKQGDGEREAKLIINLLRISGGLNISNMRSLVSLKVATAEAIAEKLFANAVRSCDFRAIELMLEVGMSPDAPVMNGEGKGSSPPSLCSPNKRQ
ncbi:hypothetical protein N7453_011821 [Penicillium expansum]|nr:hypothetical protein N7453_011821 [Penicillium expansum]